MGYQLQINRNTAGSIKVLVLTAQKGLLPQNVPAQRALISPSLLFRTVSGLMREI